MRMCAVQKAYWDPTGIALPTLEVDYHSVLANSVRSPPGAGPEGECFTSLTAKTDGCNSHSIGHRSLFPSKAAAQRVGNFLSPGSPATSFMAQAALRAGSSSNQLGVAAVATVAVALRRGVSTSDVSPFEAQWTQTHKPLSTAIIYFETAMASTDSFAPEQLVGVLGVPLYNLNDVWNPATTNHTEALRMLRAVAAQKRGARTAATLPFAPGGKPLTVAELFKALDAIGPAPAKELLVLPASNADQSSSAILLRDIREVLMRYLAWGVAVEPSAPSSPFRGPRYRLVDSFNRKGARFPSYSSSGDIGGPELSAANASSWRSQGLTLMAGHL